ncbi:hypothetical protein SAFG77S_05415 [Streptomyces afghaniensis]
MRKPTYGCAHRMRRGDGGGMQTIATSTRAPNRLTGPWNCGRSGRLSFRWRRTGCSRANRRRTGGTWTRGPGGGRPGDRACAAALRPDTALVPASALVLRADWEVPFEGRPPRDEPRPRGGLGRRPEALPGGRGRLRTGHVRRLTAGHERGQNWSAQASIRPVSKRALSLTRSFHVPFAASEEAFTVYVVSMLSALPPLP